MPLRAVINDVQVQAFNLDSQEWLQLKSNYKNSRLVMDCCGYNAIPKTSKLGTQYFAHARRGECCSAPETAEHLKLKTIVAQAASKAGWNVVTEFKGNTPSGEAWVADVYCQKGQSQIVFEIQWSHQAYSEYERRTRKYIASGIDRCAWLYRGYKNSDNQILESMEIPCFAISVEDDAYKIKKFDLDVGTFVEGMFNRKLKWQPLKGQLLTGYGYYNESRCPKCGGVNNYFCSMEANSKEGQFLGGGLYFGDAVQEIIEMNIPPPILREHLIGSLDHIYNKRGNYAYMAHGCLHCNEVQCNHTYRYDYHSDKSRSIKFSFPYDPELLYLKPEWYFIK
ncbi:hypothetical protein OQJ65_03775 [Vibrio sp. Sgm 22]|uniref:competence protein CoiA family protein n=1 Tax=unclassified Vibrio TaxID=2614977 RepID=UPI0022499356|nr:MULTISPECIES: hypothetical protein [unclassified Vibrio]MCX2758973.1 hypothetical protein [Vibrio sp. 14G-20]MCX2774433.1 hypothetical protein [Vibrio sp. Sgm 22]